MPTSFLDLPREIRDIIYGLVLTSPTSHYLLTLHKTPPMRRLPSITRVHFQPCNRHFKRLPTPFTPPNLALQSTSKQIHLEARDWFWNSNTILFSCAEDTIAVLKHMGQSASRQIQKVLINIDKGWHADKTSLVKALSMLASRTRRGELREVTLVLNLSKVAVMSRNPFEHQVYDGFNTQNKRLENTIYWLEKGARAGWEAGKVKRTLEIRHDPAWFKYDWDDEEYFEALEGMVMDCHHAWRGKLTCNEELVWDNGVKVRGISRAKPPLDMRKY